MDDSQETIKVSVLVDGKPEARSLNKSSTVEQIIRDLLPEDQKARADDYALYPEDGPPLDPPSIFGDDDIPDGSVLVLTKKDGGGGACSRR